MASFARHARGDSGPQDPDDVWGGAPRLRRPITERAVDHKRRATASPTVFERTRRSPPPRSARRRGGFTSRESRGDISFTRTPTIESASATSSSGQESTRHRRLSSANHAGRSRGDPGRRLVRRPSHTRRIRARRDGRTPRRSGAPLFIRHGRTVSRTLRTLRSLGVARALRGRASGSRTVPRRRDGDLRRRLRLLPPEP